MKDTKYWSKIRRNNEDILCNYCNQKCEWVENKEVYGKNYGRSYMMWLCRDCEAYVGCHNNTKEPLGSLANKELREWRKKAKNLFIDKLMAGNWKDRHLKIKAYKWLRGTFSLNYHTSHFGIFTVEMCKRIHRTLINNL